MVKSDIELQRCGSICMTPEDQLLDCVNRNDVNDLVNLVSEHENILDTLYSRNQNILQKAIKEQNDKISVEIVNKLIELGVNVFYNNIVDEHMDVLHFAAYTLNPRILNVICKHIKNNKPNEMNSLCDGKNTALNLIIKRCDHNDKNFMKCVRILIENELDINKPDDKNLTPIFWAARKRNRELINYLLEQSHVDLDTHKLLGESARDLIEKYELSDKNLPQHVNNNVPVEEQCMVLLNSKLENEFIERFNINITIDPNYDDQYETFLQKACKKGLIGVVRKLIERKVDVNKIGTKNAEPPILIVAKEGFYEIFDLLLNNNEIIIPSDLLSVMLLNLNKKDGQTEEYRKCLDALFESHHMSNIDINYSNKEGYTPLHYASIYQDSDLVAKLLKNGANLAYMNAYKVMSIESISPSILKNHFDDCIHPIKASSKAEDYTVTFDYTSLVKGTNSGRDLEKGGRTYSFVDTDINYETDAVAYLAKNKETRPLLAHPLITSFLLIKWHNFRCFFYINFIFYLLFCISLYSYIFLNNLQDNSNDQSDGIQILWTISSAILYITFILLILREFFQILVSMKTYLRDVENYIEISLIFAIIAMLLMNGMHQQKQVCAVVILLSAFELIMLIGQIPALTTNIVMLRTVSWNFFKCLSWYAILIVAFSYSFFMLFNYDTTDLSKDDKNETVNVNEDDDDEEKEENAFVDPGVSLFKTIVMLTGEFDASSINFSNSPYMSRIIFIIFVFTIAIVLINLLNGLAVSDIQLIKSDAELYGLVARAERVNYMDKMIKGNLLPNIFQNHCYTFSKCLNTFGILRIVSNKTTLLQNLEDYKLIVNLSSWGEILSEQTSTYNYFRLYLDRNTVKRTRNILEERQRDELVRRKQEDSDKMIVDILRELKDLRESTADINRKMDALMNSKVFKK